MRARCVETASCRWSRYCTILYLVCVAAAMQVCVFLGLVLVCLSAWFLAGPTVYPVYPVWRVPPSGESIHL